MVERRRNSNVNIGKVNVVQDRITEQVVGIGRNAQGKYPAAGGRWCVEINSSKWENKMPASNGRHATTTG